MKKNTLLVQFMFVFIFLINGASVYSQSEKPFSCGTSEMYEKALKQDPGYAARQELLEQHTAEYAQQIAQQGNQKIQGVVYIIPVVFHVLHQWGPENISDAQIIDEINILNRDYRKLNADTNQIIPSFTNIAADIEVEFRLAQLDPNGNCTNGIDRIVSSKTNAADDYSKLNDWPHDKYLNVWTVKTIGTAGVAGYSYYPGIVDWKDGVLILSDYIGSIGTSSVGHSRSLGHEVGHYLNLLHTWGNTNTVGVTCGDDLVFDTPITKGYSFCPQPANAAICNPPIIENYQNYMDYSFCSIMFTEGQKTRMRAALNSIVGLRNNLWTTTNLAATGTNGTNYTCIPIAFFNPTPKYICEGTTVSFSDVSMNLNGTPVTRLWNFSGGTPSTDTAANPSIQYNTAGVYDVSLTETSSAGSDSITVTGMIIVSPLSGAMTSYPFAEGFESITVPGNDWFIINDAGTTWEQTTNTSHTGTSCMRIYNYTGNPPGTADNLISTSFDFSNVTNVQMTFWRAFAYRSTSASDAFKIYASTNCGQLWSLRYIKSGTALASAGYVTSNFLPSSSQWLMDNVNLSTPLVSGKPNVRFKFEYTQDSGNNFYLDDINLNGTVGINEISPSQVNFEVFPNPAHAKAHISFSLNEKNNVQLKIYDIAGREVKTMVEESLSAGDYQYDVESTIESGVYFVSLTIGDNHSIKKLVLN